MNDGNYSQSQQDSTYEKRARNHNQPTMQQKNIPNKHDTRQHLQQFYFKGVATSLWRVVPLGDRSLSPSGVITELVPRACTCREPARSDGVVVKGRRSVPSAQSQDRGLPVSAPGSPFLAVCGNRAQEKRSRLMKSTRRREPKRRAHTQTRRERDCSLATNRRATTGKKHEGPEIKRKRDPNRVCTPRISRGAPPLTQPRPPSGLTQKPLKGELTQLPLPRGKG